MDENEKAEIIKIADRISSERDDGINKTLDALHGGEDLNLRPAANMTGAELLDTNFREVEYIVADVLCEGSSVIHGKPKAGKSEFMLGLCLRYVVGRPVLGRKCGPGMCLFYGAEDSPARLKRRIIEFARRWHFNDDEYDRVRQGFMWNTDVSRINERLKVDLDHHLARFPQTRLIVFDMFKNIKPDGNDKDVYRSDAAVGHFMTKYCHDYHGLSMVAVHHSRKLTADNPTDAAIGTGGLVGSFDTTIHLELADDERRLLHVAGRDVEPNEFNLESIDSKYTFNLVDEEAEYTARKRVYLAVSSTSDTPTRSIVEYSDQTSKVVAHHLKKLIGHGLIKKTDRGLYTRTKKGYFD